MSGAAEAGDTTLVRQVTLRPNPPSLDYTCSCCGRRLSRENYHAYIGDDLKLVLTAICCNRTVQWRIYLNMGGRLFDS